MKSMWGANGAVVYMRGLELGKALHTLADLYCPSHVWRDDPGGEILMFQDYNAQHPKKHKYADQPLDPCSWEWKNNYIRMCYEEAARQTRELLKMFKDGTPAYDPVNHKGVYDWLLNGPLKLGPDAVNGGTDPSYARSSTTKFATALQTRWALA